MKAASITPNLLAVAPTIVAIMVATGVITLANKFVVLEETFHRAARPIA